MQAPAPGNAIMRFSLAHVKERYKASVADRSVSLHAPLAEMLGTGIVMVVGTSAVQFSRDALNLAKVINQSPFNDRAPLRTISIASSRPATSCCLDCAIPEYSAA